MRMRAPAQERMLWQVRRAQWTAATHMTKLSPPSHLRRQHATMTALCVRLIKGYGDHHGRRSPRRLPRGRRTAGLRCMPRRAKRCARAPLAELNSLNAICKEVSSGRVRAGACSHRDDRLHGRGAQKRFRRLAAPLWYARTLRYPSVCSDVAGAKSRAATPRLDAAHRKPASKRRSLNGSSGQTRTPRSLHSHRVCRRVSIACTGASAAAATAPTQCMLGPRAPDSSCALPHSAQAEPHNCKEVRSGSQAGKLQACFCGRVARARVFRATRDPYVLRSASQKCLQRASRSLIRMQRRSTSWISSFPCGAMRQRRTQTRAPQVRCSEPAARPCATGLDCSRLTITCTSVSILLVWLQQGQALHAGTQQLSWTEAMVHEVARRKRARQRTLCALQAMRTYLGHGTWD